MPGVSSCRLGSLSDRISGVMAVMMREDILGFVPNKHLFDDIDGEQDDEQGEGDLFEDRLGKMPRTAAPLSLQSTLWQGLLFQV